MYEDQQQACKDVLCKSEWKTRRRAKVGEWANGERSGAGREVLKRDLFRA